MGYRTILKYICDKCGYEKVFDEVDSGPQFNKEDWTIVRVGHTVYHDPYRNDGSDTSALYCPDCYKSTRIEDLITLCFANKRNVR